jgi:hypothetical protein
MGRKANLLVAALTLAASFPGPAQDRNVLFPVPELERMLQSDPLRIVSAQISRPKAAGDITLRAEVAFADRPPLRVKLRRAEPGADTFNNVPRYDQAAYELQKLLLDPPDYVVPPSALRLVPLAQLKPYAPAASPTFSGSNEVLCVVQYWLQDVIAPADVLDNSQLQSDAVYERHIGQLNVVTYLIRHGDSNAGNFLISKEPAGARVFSVDNGVAFNSEESDRGELWRSMRVKRLPADVVERLRKLTEDDFKSRLGVVGQWRLSDGRFLAVPPGKNVASNSGVRRDGPTVQMGLTRREISDVWYRAKRLLKMIDDKEIVAF